MAQKRGELTIQWIIIAIIGLIALAIIVYIFVKQIGDQNTRVDEFGLQIDNARNNTICENFYQRRTCLSTTSTQTTCESFNEGSTTYERAPPPQGGWSDCKEAGQLCCVRT